MVTTAILADSFQSDVVLDVQQTCNGHTPCNSHNTSHVNKFQTYRFFSVVVTRRGEPPTKDMEVTHVFGWGSVCCSMLSNGDHSVTMLL